MPGRTRRKRTTSSRYVAPNVRAPDVESIRGGERRRRTRRRRSIFKKNRWASDKIAAQKRRVG